MNSTICNNCGGPKLADKFRACPDCRAAWRENDRIRKIKRPARPSETRRKTVTVDRDILATLTPHAEAREITANELARRILANVADDNLIDAILDDRDTEKDSAA